MSLDLVVALPDGRTFTRHAPSPVRPSGDAGFEQWAQFFAAVLELVASDTDGDSIPEVTRRWANRDFARDALLGWHDWLGEA